MFLLIIQLFNVLIKSFAMKNLVIISFLVFFCTFNMEGQCFYYQKNPDFNCHQYVRGCVTGLVDLDDQKPLSPLNGLISTNINSSFDFIKVCNALQSDAASQIYSDHSSFKANYSGYGWWATPGYGSNLLCSGMECVGNSNGGAGCFVEYFAYIGDVFIPESTQSLVPGIIYTFTLENLPSSVTISNVTFVSPSCAELVSISQSSFEIKPLVLGCEFIINVELQSQCSGGSTKIIKKSCSIGSLCAGKINNSNLNTYNVVQQSNNVVTMNFDGWTWTKVSGSANFGISNNGKTLSFNLPSGCVTFKATKSGCGILTFTFCRQSTGNRSFIY
ncbi:MAG: hypothetical protein U0T36_01735 [Saprospiraceae bacterium]